MSARNRRGLLRQGNVLLIPIDQIAVDATATTSGTRLVLAEGEATGHAHAVVADDAKLVESPDGTLYRRSEHIARIETDDGIEDIALALGVLAPASHRNGLEVV